MRCGRLALQGRMLETPRGVFDLARVDGVLLARQRARAGVSWLATAACAALALWPLPWLAVSLAVLAAAGAAALWRRSGLALVLRVAGRRERFPLAGSAAGAEAFAFECAGRTGTAVPGRPGDREREMGRIEAFRRTRE